MALTDKTIKALKPRQKPYKQADEKGLYLLVNPNGNLLWRLKYRVHGREKVLALGQYPDVTLAKAREGREGARRELAKGSDPATLKRTDKAASANTFKAIAQEWLAKQNMAPATREKTEWIFGKLVFPSIGNLPVRAVGAPEVLDMLKPLEARGKIESAHRAKQRVGQVMRYATSTGRAAGDPTGALRGALPGVRPENRPAITKPERVGELLRAIDGYGGGTSAHYALRLAPLVFVRPGELRGARWDEFHLEGEQPEWRIPAERMKMRDAHVVPLSRQAVELLRQLRKSSHGELLFASTTHPDRPISEATLGAGLRRLGFPSAEMVPHGFRSMASTLLNEQKFDADVIELQLAHKERNKVRAAYNRAERIAERRAMMQQWADYLDTLRTNQNNVIPIHRKPKVS